MSPLHIVLHLDCPAEDRRQHWGLHPPIQSSLPQCHSAPRGARKQRMSSIRSYSPSTSYLDSRELPARTADSTGEKRGSGELRGMGRWMLALTYADALSLASPLKREADALHEPTRTEHGKGIHEPMLQLLGTGLLTYADALSLASPLKREADALADRNSSSLSYSTLTRMASRGRGKMSLWVLPRVGAHNEAKSIQ